MTGPRLSPDLQWVPVLAPGGLEESRALAQPSDLQALEHTVLLQGRFNIRAPLTQTCELVDDTGAPTGGADIDQVLALKYHRGKLYVVGYSVAQTDVYLYRLEVDGTAESGDAEAPKASPIATIWSSVVSVPRVVLESFQGGSATAGVNRLFLCDTTGVFITRYWNSDAETIHDVEEDFDDDGTKEDLTFHLIFPFASHLFGTAFYQSGVIRPELLRISQPGLIPAGEPGVTNNVSREWWFSDFREVGARGEAMTCAFDVGTTKCLAKRRALYLLSGYDLRSFSIRPLDSKTGALGPRAGASLPEGRGVVWGDRGPYLITPQGAQDIGESIRGRIQRVTLSADTCLEYSTDDGILYCIVAMDGGAPTVRLAWDVFAEKWVGEGSWRGLQSPVQTLYGLAAFTVGSDTLLKNHATDSLGMFDDGGLATADKVTVLAASDRAHMTFTGGGFRDVAKNDTDVAYPTSESWEFWWDSERDTEAGGAQQIGVMVRCNDAVGAGDDSIRLVREKVDTSTVKIRVIRVSGNVVVDNLDCGNVAMSESAGQLRIGCTVAADQVTYQAWTAPYGGGPKTLLGSPVTVTASYADGSHVRAGLVADQNSGYWDNFTIADQDISGLGATGRDLAVNDLKLVPDDTLPGPAAAPAGVTVAVTSDVALTPSWTNGDTAIDVVTDVHRSTTTGFTPGAGNLVATVPSGVASYLDSGLTPETPYYYKLIHRRNGQSSAASAQATGTTAVTTPTVCQALSLAGGVRVRVTNNSSGADLVIERKPPGGSFSTLTTLLNQATGQITHDDTTTTCGLTYTYRVKAQQSGITDSPYSNEASREACNTAPTLSGATHKVTLAADCPGADNVVVTWTGADLKPSDTVKIYQNSDGGGFVLRDTVPAQNLNATDVWPRKSGGTEQTLQYRVELYDGGTTLVDTRDSTERAQDVSTDVCLDF